MSGRSCVTNLLATLEDWTSILDFESSVDIYLDFSKAFHSVRHGVKLRALGLQSEVLAWIDGFLMDRYVNVFVLTDSCLIGLV